MFEYGPIFDRQRSIRGVRNSVFGMFVEQLTEGGKGMQTTKRGVYADQHLPCS